MKSIQFKLPVLEKETEGGLDNDKHVEGVCLLVRKITDDNGQEDNEKKERQKIASVEEGGKKKINYREEEIEDCGCIYG